MIQIGNTNLWYDPVKLEASREFLKQKEKEYWEWVFSGQRTLELFGEEGAKIVLAEQAKRDESNRRTTKA